MYLELAICVFLVVILSVLSVPGSYLPGMRHVSSNVLLCSGMLNSTHLSCHVVNIATPAMVRHVGAPYTLQWTGLRSGLFRHIATVVKHTLFQDGWQKASV